MCAGASARSVGEPGLRIQTLPWRVDLREVRVAVDDGVAAGEAPHEPFLRAPPRAGDVGHPDARAARLDDELLRQQLADGRLVGVAEDGVDRRAERAQLLEHRQRRDVAAVEDQVGGAQPLEARLGDPSRSPAAGACPRSRRRARR